MEDVDKPPDKRIAWFCIKVFVSTEYVSHMKSDAPPLVGRRILDLWRTGQSPLRNLMQIREANSPGGAGVNILVLNSGAPQHVTETDRWSIIAGKMVEFTPLCAGGYRLHELLIEVYDEFTCAWVVGTGMSLRTDYADYYRRHGGDGPRARLYGVTEAETRQCPGTAFSAVFPLHVPRYFFSLAEQELLQWALFGEMDQNLAAELGVSLAAIKKRWIGVYTKISMITPDFLEDSREPTDQRGAEKRRTLLGYLQHHLEELRPVLPRKC